MSVKGRHLFTSESVTEGHPDKICDQISDAVLDAFLTNDPNARVACEVSVATGLVLVIGEISTKSEYVDIPSIVRNTIKDIGYTRAKYGFDYNTCAVLTSLNEQSPDIAQELTLLWNTAILQKWLKKQQTSVPETKGSCLALRRMRLQNLCHCLLLCPTGLPVVCPKFVRMVRLIISVLMARHK